MNELQYTSLCFCPDCGKELIFVDGDGYCRNPECETEEEEDE